MSESRDFAANVTDGKASGHHCVRFDSKPGMLAADRDGYFTTCVCECGKVIVKSDDELAESQFKADAAYGSHVKRTLAADRLAAVHIEHIGEQYNRNGYLKKERY